MIRRQIQLTGQVQGVGCRPFIYRLASRLDLTGTVRNDTAGVTIQLQGPKEKIDAFIDTLTSPGSSPPLMSITDLTMLDIPTVENEKNFSIIKSDSADQPTSQVAPDMSTCIDCLRELNEPKDMRYRYPFINCTNCGPRYSIVKTIPYDRPNTTMSGFKMCPACKSQYADPADRRFHAQPVACPQCGPSVSLTDNTGMIIETDSDAVIKTAAKMLTKGKVLAIKGIGGFHLAVDAFNDKAVKLLRKRKHRDHKPFAMMAPSIDTIKQFATVDPVAEKLLTCPQAPIVLLPKINQNTAIAPSIAQGTSTLGFMLCYAPLHHLLFDQPGIDVLVMTSANISDEPLIADNSRALEKLSGVADAFLMHDRDIYRQLDDSVIHIINKKPAFLRRSRGYVPSPMLLDKPAKHDIFAAGADLKNTFCFVKENQLILSEHIGDLEDALVYRHYTDSVEHLRKLFQVQPQTVACDLHPCYLSTQFAKSLDCKNLIAVQHHWAHIASVLAEFKYDDPVIGIVADGTGFGTDGAIWGCECLIASLKSFERVGHLSYYPLPGSDRAAKEAIRPILGLLKKYLNSNTLPPEHLDWLNAIEPDSEKINLIWSQLQKNLNVIQTSSLGRIFDTVAAMVGLGSYNHFEAQLPMALESIVDTSIADHYDFDIQSDNNGVMLLDLQKTFFEIINDRTKKIHPPKIAAKFHNCLAQTFLAMALCARETSTLNTVALSGGVFCNRYLAERLITLLKQNDFSVLFKNNIPANDGGIALGQAAIAAAITRQD